jgi:hypothetical protein
MEVVVVNDSSSKLAVKDAILVRSGIYNYSKEEVLGWGITPSKDKPFYREYRPAGVLISARDKFNMVPVTKNHPFDDVDEKNFHTFASGVTGGPIDAVALEDGEIALKGQIAFFTRDAFDFYSEGNRETSPGFEKVVHAVDNADEVGYDFVLKEIKSVNHMAIVPKGRGGSKVRVMDKAITIGKTFEGGIGMDKTKKVRTGILGILGFVKAKDENFKFSTVLLDSVAKVHTLDKAGLEKEVAGVMDHISNIGDSEAKEILVGMVSDCYKHPVEVIAQREKVAVKIDELYAKCCDADSAIIQKILDSADDKETKDEKDDKAGKDDKKDKEDKPVDAKDMAALIDAAVQKAVTTVADSYNSKIEAAVNKALGLEEKKTPEKTQGADVPINTLDSAAVAEDLSWMFR